MHLSPTAILHHTGAQEHESERVAILPFKGRRNCFAIFYDLAPVHRAIEKDVSDSCLSIKIEVIQGNTGSCRFICQDNQRHYLYALIRKDLTWWLILSRSCPPHRPPRRHKAPKHVEHSSCSRVSIAPASRRSMRVYLII